jgi:hypothetical protein
MSGATLLDAPNCVAGAVSDGVGTINGWLDNDAADASVVPGTWITVRPDFSFIVYRLSAHPRAYDRGSAQPPRYALWATS